jgi:membrane-bound serine protease (ClpP class)
MNRLLLFVAIICSPTLLSVAQKVISINVNGTINPASAAFIERSITKAERENAECLIIHLNTPGGLLKSTRQIVTDILASRVPVVVYVSPGGAHAGSAGVFITMAAHIAAMAPGTNMGAAHPVSLQGPIDTIMNDKTTNDAAAFIRTIAQKRKRNLEWAEEAVRKSVSITENEALQKNVIDLIAANDNELLKNLDNKEIALSSGTKKLHTKNASLVTLGMTALEKFLDTLSDPNIAYILMMLGFYGLLFELYSPGAIFPGIVGGICIILAFYAMHTLPVNYAGLALIIFGIILLLLEIKVTSHGMLAIGGIICLVLGSFFLFDTNSALEFFKISKTIIFTITGVSAMFFLFMAWMGINSQRVKPVSGMEALIGLAGETLTILNPSGSVRVHGELWSAETLSGEIDKGKKVCVTGISGLKLFVEPCDEATLI